jgi:muconolactone delta-isomerase
MRYMASVVTIEIPDPAVLPAEMERARELTEQGVLVAAYIAHDRQSGWLVINADSLDAALAAVRSLPLARFWRIEMTELVGR